MSWSSQRCLNTVALNGGKKKQDSFQSDEQMHRQGRRERVELINLKAFCF